MPQMLRLDFTLASGDYTAPGYGWVEVTPLTARGYRTQRLLVTAGGMTGAGSIAFYEAEAGKGSLNDAEMAASELIPSTAVNPGTNPVPALDVTAEHAGYIQPKVGSSKGSSLYMRWRSNGADAAVSVHARLWIELR